MIRCAVRPIKSTPTSPSLVTRAADPPRTHCNAQSPALPAGMLMSLRERAAAAAAAAAASANAASRAAAAGASTGGGGGPPRQAQQQLPPGADLTASVQHRGHVQQQ